MTTYFVSDIHLDPGRPDTYQKFIDYLNGIASDAQELYILGDLFEYWIGDDAIDYLGHRPIVNVFQSLASKNIGIYVMHGNRDFLIGYDFVNEFDGTLIFDPTVLKIYGQNVILAHGDSFCTDDVEHQKFRTIVNSPEWQEQFLSLPLNVRNERAVEMRKQSETGKLSKSLMLMDVNQSAIVPIMQRHNSKILIHGHVHKPGIYDFNLNGNTVHRYVMGDWDSGTDGVIVMDSSGKINLCQP